jgi:hypothetical protein
MRTNLPMCHANTVWLSDSNYTRFSLHITQNFVYYTKRIHKTLSLRAVGSGSGGVRDE